MIESDLPSPMLARALEIKGMMKEGITFTANNLTVSEWRALQGLREATEELQKKTPEERE